MVNKSAIIVLRAMLFALSVVDSLTLPAPPTCLFAHCTLHTALLQAKCKNLSKPEVNPNYVPMYTP